MFSAPTYPWKCGCPTSTVWCVLPLCRPGAAFLEREGMLSPCWSRAMQSTRRIRSFGHAIAAAIRVWHTLELSLYHWKKLPDTLDSSPNMGAVDSSPNRGLQVCTVRVWHLIGLQCRACVCPLETSRGIRIPGTKWEQSLPCFCPFINIYLC